jgi:hypothetical protein
MNKKILLFFTLVLVIVSCKNSSEGFRTIKHEVLKDKIAGSWAGKIIGVTYSAPTEFRAQGKIFSDPITWKPSDIKGSLWQDDVYVQLTLLMSIDKYGVDARRKGWRQA